MIFKVPFILVCLLVSEAESSRAVMVTGANPGSMKIKTQIEECGLVGVAALRPQADSSAELG